MTLDDGLDDGESQSAAARGLPRDVSLIEAFEDQRQVLVWNAGSGIANGQRRPFRTQRAVEANLASRRCVAQRVGREVLQCLLETIGISNDVLGPGIHVMREVHVPFTQLALVSHRDAREDRVHVHALAPEGCAATFEAGKDWRAGGVAFGQPIFRGDNLKANVGVAERLRREIAEPRGVSLSQLALAWVLGNPAISTALVGARTPAEVDANDAGAELDLTADERARIDLIVADARGRVKEFTPLRPAMEPWGAEIQ